MRFIAIILTVFLGQNLLNAQGKTVSQRQDFGIIIGNLIGADKGNAVSFAKVELRNTKTDSLIRTAFAEKIPNTTKLIIAQRIASVQDADKIIVMDNGKIDAIGTHEELLKTNEIYKEVYESQTKGGLE